MKKLNSRGPYVCYSLNNTISFLIAGILILCTLLLLFVHFPIKKQIQPEPLPTMVQQAPVVSRPTLCAPPLNALDRLRNSYIRNRFERIGHLICETSNTIKPLYGRPLDRRENKWHYYTSEHINTNLNEIVQLPIIVNNRECMNDWGCNELYDNDIVNVENNSNTFRVKIYKQLT